MPMHDWSRVDVSIYHDFHQCWTMELSNRLNAGLLPPGYAALVEPHAGLTSEYFAPNPNDSIEELLSKRANRIAIR